MEPACHAVNEEEGQAADDEVHGSCVPEKRQEIVGHDGDDANLDARDKNSKDVHNSLQ